MIDWVDINVVGEYGADLAALKIIAGIHGSMYSKNKKCVAILYS